MASSPGSSSVKGEAQIWDTRADLGSNIDAEPRKSLYVEIFDSVQSIVLEHEKYLFSQSEVTCFERLRALSYPARYLLIRLCLCKRGKWHTLSSLEARYRPEIGDGQSISRVIDELCGIRCLENVDAREVIDLTLDEDGDASGCAQEAAGDVALARDELSTFAVDDTAASVQDLLACLSSDELKSIAKQLKVARTQSSRPALIDTILSNASQQSTLSFPVLSPRRNSAKSGGPPVLPLTLNFSRDGKKGTQHAVVRRLVSKLTGRCVRIEPAVFTLFDRLNLVFFRSTTHSPSLLLPALLSAFRKRQYGSVGVEYQRSANIFPSREALLAYEEALALEFRVDEVLGGENGALPRGQMSNAKSRQIKSKGKSRVEDAPTRDRSRVEGARAVREIWERVYDRWKALMACKEGEKTAGFERFECGHVLTRIVHKGSQALAMLKEYELEMEVLKALLSQGKWRRGRRGAWYDRLALVLMTHCERSQENLEMAMQVVINGLQDELTHMTYRPRLERRLTRLENMLKIPKDRRHKCDGQLRRAEEVYVEGVRIYKAPVVLERSGSVQRPEASPFPDRDRVNLQTPSTMVAVSTQPRDQEFPKGKTLWVGRQGAEVSVEQLALEHYEDMGFKGFHSEGSIVSTIFGLLFWDIIFAPIPGAFETPYQTAPLDIHEDGFFPARKELIERRLQELEAGQARKIIGQVDERERPAKAICIGVDWNFERDDLLEIVDCLGGHALGSICRMICEDYSQWRGGVPDLCVWNAKAGTCKFVEVKSPNDTLQENQKVWIDILLGSETSVDLCHVTEKGAEKKSKERRGGKRENAVVHLSDLESEDDQMEDVGPEDENRDMLGSSEEEVEEQSKRALDSEELVLSQGKHKLEVLITSRKRRK